ncbi:uncharacterized protein LOC120090094 [Benincasa hispida]|uniref:uncharacterized protein LOC120090094 n=1 Tax=Benincasa hispida TaxID=102211 RepID=UPI001902C11E|nr:uncharacterized protein LOC120090094 [Benincasa hispida]
MKEHRLYVPNDEALKNAVLEKAHSSSYSIHPDEMNKTTKFLPVKATSTPDQLAKTYVDKVVSQFRAPVLVVSGRDLRITLNYNSCIRMAPYEALYGKPCRIPVCWNEVEERKLVGPELVQITSDNVKLIRENLKMARDRQKSYAYKRRRELEFEIGDRVFLRLSPWKGILRLAAYIFALPTELFKIHDVFHVSMLKKYVPDPTQMLQDQPVQLKENLSYEEELIQILD